MEPGVSYFPRISETQRSAGLFEKFTNQRNTQGGKEYRGMESRNGARLNELSLSISDRFRRRDVTYEALRINGRKGGGKKGARGPGLICRNKLHRKKCKIECRNASPVFLLCPCNAVDPAWRGGLSGVSSGQDENVGSFNVSRGGWQREREGDGGGGRGTRSNLRGIEDLVHSYPPTSRPRPAESSLGLNAPIPFP